MTSAYPIPADVLEDRVRALATSQGGWPSQRRVMRECRVGAPRADAALTAVRASGFDPRTPARPLTVVPDTPTETATDIGAEADTGADADGDAAPDRDSTGPLADAPEPDTSSAPASDAGAVDDRPAEPVAVAENKQLSTAAETPEDAPTATPEAVPAPVTADAPGAGSGRVPRWPLVLIALGAFVSIWSGWVGLGELTGFGPIRPLPGIWDGLEINTAITLPIGVEAYAAFALRAWLAPTATLSATARRFACWSALGALGLGAGGQIAYHLMVAAGLTHAPWQITAFVSCLPVVVLGCGAALTHLIRQEA